MSTETALAPRLLLALAGGLATAAAFPPLDLPVLAVGGVAAFALATRDLTVRRGALVGLVYGLGFQALLLWWLWASIAPGAWAALSVVQALWLALLGALASPVRRLPGGIAWLAVLWVAVETLRSTWPLGGMPWGRLGFSAVDTPWQSWLAWGGVTGAGLVVALLGVAVAEAVARRRTAGVAAGVAAGALALAVLPAAVGGVGDDEPSATTARLMIVQGGVPGAGNDLVAHHRQVTANHLAETERLVAGLEAADQPPPDLVLWPENATAVDATEDETARAQLQAAAAAAGAPLLAGSISDGPTDRQARNQGILWSAEGVPGARYTKRHLVPFGEYVPFRALATRISSRVAEIERDMVPGEIGDPLEVGRLSIADALCFDVAYDDVIGPQVRRGATLVTVQTSNAMFLGTDQPAQQWEISRARAVETGRSVVVASINGISGAIAPDGRVATRLPDRVTTGAVVEVPLETALTPATRLGPWPARAAVALGLLLALAAVVRGARARAARAPSTISASSRGEVDGE
ncbi:apolipoprotein N-acyltransferase [Nocardioides hungaricus]